MKKLNKQKIKWIVRESERREQGFYSIAKQQKITARHARRVANKYCNDRNPILKKCGRKQRTITEEERELIVKTYKEYVASATMIEQIFDEKGKHTNHNRIHKILLEAGLAKPNIKKQKKRKYKCYERKHSLSLAHTDWAEFKRRKFILFEDDASRMILAYGEFENATADKTILLLKKALDYGKIRELITDQGPQFTSDLLKDFCEANNIQQIFGRINRPQTNGKIERWYGLYRQKRHLFDSLKDFVYWYNQVKPHLSLNFEELETPAQAFRRKFKS